MKQLLSVVGKIIEKHDSIRKAKCESFNIFSILGMERREVDTHSAFLYELINPKGSHYQGSKFLKVFLESINLGKLVETSDLDNATVNREYPIEGGKRIDLLIELDNDVIVIEMKTDSIDSDDQLKDYYIFFEKNSKRRNHYYYLTLYGSDPENADLDIRKKFTNLSFASDIKKFIDISQKECARIPILRESLYQYLLLIDKITNQIGDEEMQDIEKVLNSPERAAAATNLYNAIPEIWARREKIFWDGVYSKIKIFLQDEPEYEPRFEFYSYYEWGPFDENKKSDCTKIMEQRKRSDGDYGICISKKIGNQYITFLFYIHNDDPSLKALLGIESEEQDEWLSPDILNKLAKSLNLNKKYGKRFYQDIECKDKFFLLKHDKKQVDSDIAYWLFSDSLLEARIDSASKAIIEFFKGYKKHEPEILESIQSK